MPTSTSDRNVTSLGILQCFLIPAKEFLLQLLTILSQLLTIFAQLLKSLAQLLATSL
jgi:hypothetical protein